VDEDIAKSGYAPKLRSKLTGKSSKASELVNRACVVRHISALARGDVSRDIERVLGTKLEASLDRPPFLRVSIEILNGCPAMLREHAERLSERSQVPVDNTNVDNAGSQGQGSP